MIRYEDVCVSISSDKGDGSASCIFDEALGTLSHKQVKRLIRGIRNKKRKEIVVEWWEIWWKKPGEEPRRQVPDRLPSNILVPVHGYENLDLVREFFYKRAAGFYKITHVRRTRKVKQ